MTHIIPKGKKFKDFIHMIRGQQVMLDSDLAKLYGTEVKNLNRQVKRNIEKFPLDFMFQLTKQETNELVKCHFGTAPNNLMMGNDGGRRTLPYVFSEQGIYMVATILKNDIATQQSIYIIREFKKMKHYIAENSQFISYYELSNINHRLDQHEADIHKIMDNFIDEANIKEKIFFDGQVYDAAETYIKIYKQAKKSIYIIDDYINMDTLHLLKKKQKNVDVILFTRNISKDKISKFDVETFNKQYPQLLLKYVYKIHDRFIVIDYGTQNEAFYVCGASSKDAGQKVCTITQLYDSKSLHTMMKTLLECKDFLFKN